MENSIAKNMENNYLLQLSNDFNSFINQNLPSANVAGMDLNTGKWLDLNLHIEQQLQDLMLTPRGTSIMYPYYGSAMMYYMDMPISAVGMDLQIEATKVIKKYETRITIINTNVTSNSTVGALNLNIEYANAKGEVNNVNI